MGEGGSGSGKKKGSDRAIVNEQLHRNFVERHPYQEVSEEEMASARLLMAEEMKVVKSGMSHGEVCDIFK
jgi:hypothetical protein